MNSKIFSSAFPAPKFLDLSYSGVSISDDFIRCIKFSKKNGRLTVDGFVQKTLPEGLVVSGVINNIKEVSNILTSLKKDLKLSLIKVSLPEEKAYLFNTKIPRVEQNEIMSSIEFKMEENVPVPLSDLTFDYVITNPLGHKDHVDIVVSALPTKIIDSYTEMVQNAGLSILSLEIESQAVARALLPKDYTGAALIVHFGKERVGLYVVSNRIVHFTSTITTKGSPSENLQFVSGEIKKLYIYWHTLKENIDEDNKKISEIIVCGEGVSEEVVSHFSANIKTNVFLGNVWTNVLNVNEVVPPISFADSLCFAAAIGLALPGEILI